MTHSTCCTCESLEPRTLFATIKIMPLGDSITEGLAGNATYRYWLWHQLRSAGRDVDFIGTQRGVGSGSPRFPDFDQDHQGHSGYRAETILGRLDGWLAANVPDVVLLHIGSNDLFAGQSVSSTIDEVAAIIDRLRLANPRVTILLAQIIPAIISTDAIREFNSRIPLLAAQTNSATSRVIVVDQHTGFTGNDLIDGIHPSESGEKKMAARWMAALSTVGSLDPNPYLSDLPFQKATNGLGPVERDKSNGGVAANDGRTFKLNNQLFKKGLGVHAHSDVRFDLGGKYKLFRVFAGVDDEVRNEGSVIFRVFVDYRKVYDSGPVYGRTGTKHITVDVTGAQNLRLLVTDKGDGSANDHADWADARLFSEVPVGAPGGGVSGGSSGGGSTSRAANPDPQPDPRSIWQKMIDDEDAP